MKRGQAFIKNTVILSLGNFLPKFISIVTLPIITGRLTKTEYGVYDLIITLIMLVLPIATLQIQSAAFRFLIECREDNKKIGRIISNIYVVTLPISAIVSLIIPKFIGDAFLEVKMAIALYFFADILFITTSQIVRGLALNVLYSISAVILSLINCVGIIIALVCLDGGLFGVILSLGVANLMASIYMVNKAKLLHYIDFRSASWKVIRELVSYSWPMIPNNLSSWILKSSDRLVIISVLGIEANAVYAVANKLPNMLAIAQSVVVMAWQESAALAVNDKDADTYYTKMHKEMFAFVSSCTMILVAFTPVLFRLLIKGDYQEAYIQIPILVLGMFFSCMSSFQGGIYIAHKKTKDVGVTTIIAATINVVLDIILIKELGITAGSISTVVAYLWLYIYRMYDIRRFQKIQYDYKKIISLLLLLVITLALCSIQNWWTDVINMIVSSVLFIVLNREFINVGYKKVLEKVGR